MRRVLKRKRSARQGPTSRSAQRGYRRTSRRRIFCEPLEDRRVLAALVGVDFDLIGGLTGAADRNSELDDRFTELAFGLFNYHDVYLQFPAGADPNWFDADGNPYVSWRVHLLPFIGYTTAHQQSDLKRIALGMHSYHVLERRSSRDRPETTTGLESPTLRMADRIRFLSPKLGPKRPYLGRSQPMCRSG